MKTHKILVRYTLILTILTIARGSLARIYRSGEESGNDSGSRPKIINTKLSNTARFFK